ncbi:hypothetical protein Mgra_00009072 [Meloidogyne graminicola]|uniref:Uncharacterized protein n=1 Tax=Meloidogyne graminicola TaxID=189291 RepID=A0A8S9ZE11_9BILA|nr:hypothetical protein Mgra_00009072 [Meloidogyne graminicola]
MNIEMPSHSRRSESRERDSRRRSTRKRSRESSERRHKKSFRSEKRRGRDRSKSISPNDRIYAPIDVACELGGERVNMAQLDRKTVEWLQEKINDQVSFDANCAMVSN